MAIAAQRATQSLGRSVRLYKNNTDGKGASYGTHENYLLQRSTPVRPDRHPVHRLPGLPAGDHRRRPGRDRPGQPAAGLPDQPARGLLRGRGGSGDHAEPADHQHPRRAARRRQPAPPAARDHRRREPVRDRHLPEGRQRRLGAAGDRGRRAGQRRCGWTRRWRRCARSATTCSCAETVPLADGRTCLTGRRAGGLSGRVPAALRAGRRRPDRGRPDRGQGRLHPLAGLPRRAAQRHLQPGRPARLGGQAEADGVLPASATVWAGQRRSWP